MDNFNLVIAAVCIAISIYVICNLFGQVVVKKFNLETFNLPSLIGLSFYFSCLMVVCAPLTIFRIKTSICAVIFVSLLLMMLIFDITNIKKISLKQCVIYVPVLLVTLLLLIRSSQFSLGSTSDSVFYMSMVNENAFSPFWTPLEYYTGSPIDTNAFLYQPQYDFQAFYHLFAYIIKFVAQIIPALSHAPVYIWCALTMFLLFMVDTITTIALNLFKKNKGIALIFLLFSLAFSTSSWNLLYAYIGNSWRILFLTLSLMSIYYYFRCDRLVYLFLLCISTGGLIATTSSGIFINSFIIFGLLTYELLRKNVNKIQRVLSIYGSYCFTALYATCYFYSYYHKVAIIIPIIYVIGFLALFLYVKLTKNKVQLITLILIGLVTLGLVVISIIYPSTFTYIDFLKRNINEMSVNYFVFDDVYTVCGNVLWMSAVIVIGLKFKQQLFKTDYVKFLMVVILLFLNPFVGKVWMTFIAGIVYYRSYEILFNYFTFIFIAYGLYLQCQNIKPLYVVVALVSVVAAYGNFNDNPYYFDLDEPIDVVYRIPVTELEADLALAQETEKEKNRVRVISQLPFTKGIVNNINLSFGISTTRSFCTTCNELEGPVECPSPIFNLFLLRDYADQMIYSTPADYDGACDVLFERGFKYLLLDKGQTRIDNGVYVPVFHCMRACNDVTFENDNFVLMKSRYVV